MGGLAQALVAQERPVTTREWDAFWNRLEGRRVDRREATDVVVALSMQPPETASVDSLVASLDARRTHTTQQCAVNIVGTGGGPATFNISTAAALVAASIGVPVIKSGSRGISSRHGSIDMLELLGVKVATSGEAMRRSLEQFGVAFVGSFVYPPQLASLAKAILPLDIRKVGGFFKRIAPLLADMPVSVQVTGMASLEDLALLRHLARVHVRHPVWLCHNELGIDELVSFQANVIQREPGEGDLSLTPSALELAPGSSEELAPASGVGPLVAQFHALLDGKGSAGAVETICLNAAALAVAGGIRSDWRQAIDGSREAMERGEPRAILRRMGEARASVVARAPA